MNVLIADNSGIIRLAMSQIIKDVEPSGKIYEAATFEETIGALNNREMNLLIVDVNILGVAAARMISAVKLTQPDISVLVFSAYRQDCNTAHYFKAGADGYLKKNAPASEIRSAVKAMIASCNYRRPYGQ